MNKKLSKRKFRRLVELKAERVKNGTYANKRGVDDRIGICCQLEIECKTCINHLNKN